MKNIKFLLWIAVLGLSVGLQAAGKIGFINNSGEDLFARIRTERNENNVMVIHPTLNQDPHGVLNPIPNNPEIFLFKNNGVVFVAAHRLASDLRMRLWKTDYVPTIDGMTKTSEANHENSFCSKRFVAQDVKDFRSELMVFSIDSQASSRQLRSDNYKKQLARNEFAYVMDLESTEYSEIYGKVSLPNEYQSLT